MTTSIVFLRSVDLVNSVTKRIAVSQLIKKKDRILVSLSGGQDSICLLFVLNQMSDQMELDLAFFWCHHLWQIDSFFLMKQIAKLSLLFQFDSCFTIPSYFIPSELLARNWRYNCNHRVSLFYNYSKIGIAHSANDKIETVFLNLMRGTGLTGLSPLRWTQVFSKKPLVNKNIQDHVSQILPTLVSPFFWSFLHNPSNRYDISQPTRHSASQAPQHYICITSASQMLASPSGVRLAVPYPRKGYVWYVACYTTSALHLLRKPFEDKVQQITTNTFTTPLCFATRRGGVSLLSKMVLMVRGLLTFGISDGASGIGATPIPPQLRKHLTTLPPKVVRGTWYGACEAGGRRGILTLLITDTEGKQAIDEIMIKVDRNQGVFLFICCQSKDNEIIQKFSSLIGKRSLFSDLYILSRFFFLKTNFSLLLKRIVLKKSNILLHTTKMPQNWTRKKTKKKIKAKKWFYCVSYTFFKTCSCSTTNNQQQTTNN